MQEDGCSCAQTSGLNLRSKSCPHPSLSFQHAPNPYGLSFGSYASIYCSVSAPLCPSSLCSHRQQPASPSANASLFRVLHGHVACGRYAGRASALTQGDATLTP